jgi:hypothetical protein
MAGTKKKPKNAPSEPPKAAEAAAEADDRAGEADGAVASTSSDDSENAEPGRAADADASEPADAPTPWYRDIFLVHGLLLPIGLALFEMWRVRQFTVDDSYISFRYARNFARGIGLVYNPGEHVEGYTNFLWTVILGIGIKLGLDPVPLAKVLGAACAVGSMVLIYRIAGRLRPYTAAPCLATWLFATSAPSTGYPVFGLETAPFVFLILAGVDLFFREEKAFDGGATSRVPWSGVVFGLAGLTRPEAPMYIGVLMLFLGLGIFSRRNLLRGALFVAIVGAHLLFRHAYYGAWVPNTLGAKTGNLQSQLRGGAQYFWSWVRHTGPLGPLALAGIGVAIDRKKRTLLAISTLGVLIVAYVILVGGDWMKDFRFLVPFEPFCFLLADTFLRELWDRVRRSAHARAFALVVVLLGIAFSANRTYELTKMQKVILSQEDRFWRMAAGGTARLLSAQPPGTIAMGDIGYIGYETDFPVLDLLGLVDANIAKMPGGYTQKTGKVWLDYFFERAPRYAIVISNMKDCRHPTTLGSARMYRDPRFLQRYHELGATPLDHDFRWCVYERNDARGAASNDAP